MFCNIYIFIYICIDTLIQRDLRHLSAINYIRVSLLLGLSAILKGTWVVAANIKCHVKEHC